MSDLGTRNLLALAALSVQPGEQYRFRRVTRPAARSLRVNLDDQGRVTRCTEVELPSDSVLVPVAE